MQGCLRRIPALKSPPRNQKRHENFGASLPISQKLRHDLQSAAGYQPAPHNQNQLRRSRAVLADRRAKEALRADQCFVGYMHAEQDVFADLATCEATPFAELEKSFSEKSR